MTTYQGDVIEHNGCTFYLDHPTNLNHVQGAFAFEITVRWNTYSGGDLVKMSERTYTGTVTPAGWVRTVADLRRMIYTYAVMRSGQGNALIGMLNLVSNKPLDSLS